MTPILRIARPCDDCRVGAAMRGRDVNEVRAASGDTPVAALKRSREGSIECFTAEYRGTPFLMCGVALIAPGIASPWLLATDEFSRHKAFILRESRAMLDRWTETMPILVNYVDVRNKSSFRYLRACGFRFTSFDPEYGAGRLPFLQFMRVPHV